MERLIELVDGQDSQPRPAGTGAGKEETMTSAGETHAETEEARNMTTDPAVVELLENLTGQLRDLEERHLATEMIVGMLAARATNPDNLINAVNSMCAQVNADPDAKNRQAFIETSKVVLRMIRAANDTRSGKDG